MITNRPNNDNITNKAQNRTQQHKKHKHKNTVLKKNKIGHMKKQKSVQGLSAKIDVG